MKKRFMLTLISILLIGVIVSCSDDSTGPSNQDGVTLVEIQGNWSGTESLSEISVVTIIIESNDMEMNVNNNGNGSDEQYIGTITIISGTNPTQIDIDVTGGNELTGTALGIVKLENGILTMCCNQPGEETRPNSFSENSGRLFVLEQLVVYTKTDLSGTWVSSLEVSGTQNTDGNYTGEMIFDINGILASMSAEEGPNWQILNSSLSVDNDGNISGTITTSHLNGNNNTETTVMNWYSSKFNSKIQISCSMNCSWSNSEGYEGTYFVSGTLTK